MGDEKVKEETMALYIKEINNHVQKGIGAINNAILLSETDKGDERCDNLHALKNRLYTAKKKLRHIKVVEFNKPTYMEIRQALIMGLRVAMADCVIDYNKDFDRIEITDVNMVHRIIITGHILREQTIETISKAVAKAEEEWLKETSKYA